MRVKLQLVMCNDEGDEETVTDVITLNKNNQQSCSSIGKNQVPQPSADTNDIVLKMLYTVAKAMY